MAQTGAYARLIALLDQRGVLYRLLDHPPEGRTELVSRLRGHPLAQAAKCMILMVKIGKKVTRFVLGVVPGDARVDLHAVKTLLAATYVSFAPSDVAARLAGSMTGTVLPFAFNPELELIVDPALLEHDEIYFNAARLDRSIALSTRDYVALAQPRLERIIERPGPWPAGASSPAAPAETAGSPHSRQDGRRSHMGTNAPYSINVDTRYAALETIDVQELVDACHDAWYNQTLCRVNDCVVRVGVMQGEFHWHKHDKEDEFFYVVEGRFAIDLEGRTVELAPRQGFMVPRGVVHRTRAPERSVVLMIEGMGVSPTGD